MISRLRNEQGVWVEDPNKLKHLAYKFYKELYPEDISSANLDVTLTFPVLPIQDRDMLNRDVSEQEIFNAVSQIGAHKSPGPDSFSPIFFQRN